MAQKIYDQNSSMLKDINKTCVHLTQLAAESPYKQMVSQKKTTKKKKKKKKKKKFLKFFFL